MQSVKEQKNMLNSVSKYGKTAAEIHMLHGDGGGGNGGGLRQ
jgi:hypothetical protein